MQIKYEVDLDYGDGPDEGEATPSSNDIENALTRGLANLGFTRDLDIIVHKL